MKVLENAELQPCLAFLSQRRQLSKVATAKRLLVKYFKVGVFHGLAMIMRLTAEGRLRITCHGGLGPRPGVLLHTTGYPVKGQ